MKYLVQIFKKKMSSFFCEIKSPTYTIYKDADVELSAKNGNMSKELQDRLIRAAVSNMVSVAYLPPFHKKPTIRRVFGNGEIFSSCVPQSQ